MSGTDPTPQELSLFVHLSEHLMAQKGHHLPALMLPDCWWWSTGVVPDWAGTLAEANAPGWTWCPWVTPGLATMSEAEHEAWAASVLARAGSRT